MPTCATCGVIPCARHYAFAQDRSACADYREGDTPRESLLTRPAFTVGERVTALVWPHRLRRNAPVLVSGSVTALTDNSLTLVTAGGFRVVRREDVRP